MFFNFMKVLYRIMLAALPIYHFYREHNAELMTNIHEANFFIVVCFAVVCLYLLIMEFNKESVCLITFSTISILAVLTLELIYQALELYLGVYLKLLIGDEQYQIKIFIASCILQGLIYLMPLCFRKEEA